MSTLLQTVTNLTQIDNWQNILNQYLNRELDAEQPSFKIMHEGVLDFREHYKVNREIPSNIKDTLGDELSDKLEKFLSESLRWYFDLELLRKIEKEHNEQTENIINLVFYDYILNVGIEPSVKIMEKLGKKEDILPSVIPLLQAMDYYVYNSIAQTINEDNISVTFQKNSDISPAASDYFAKLIYEHRIELKLNLILKNMNTED